MNTSEWPARPFIFAIIGAMSALSIYLLVDDVKPPDAYFEFRVALSGAITALGSMFCITAHRQTALRCFFYAILSALVVGGIIYWRLYLQWPEAFSFVALGLTVVVLTPFFQSALHSTFTNYKALHNFAWGNFLVGILSLLFMGMSIALAHLLASLFSLVGIDLLKELLREDLTVWLLCGTALGAAVGVLREHDKIIAATQSVVQSVFSLLVIPLALGLGAFIAVLPFTGLAQLWSSTRNTSATLFACAVFAIVVVNAAVRDDASTQTTSKIALVFARVLALVVAPLAAVGVIALKLRIEQYGWTPDRLWATVICSMLLMYGITYLFAALLKSFPAIIRKINLVLALALCALALVLATPVLDFGKVSANDQISRLSNGLISEDQLDVTALAFDFGPAGREALKSLKGNASSDLLVRIDQSLDATSRRESRNSERRNITHDVADKLIVRPSSWTVPEKLLTLLNEASACNNDGYCYLLVSKKQTDAIVISQDCNRQSFCTPRFKLFRLHNNQWRFDTNGYRDSTTDMGWDERNKVLKWADQDVEQGKFELRPVQRMQLFIDDQPFGPMIE